MAPAGKKKAVEVEEEAMDTSDIEVLDDDPGTKSAKASTSTATATKSKEPPLWVTKYRPKEFKKIVGNDAVITRLAQFAKNGNMPNLILAGPPGVGKTTTILCLARIMLGDKFEDAVLELNASNERGVDVVRNKIKMFARKLVTLPEQKHKIIILDEADSMTEGAQNALRRTMELYTKTTRFALACNNSEKIIPPIQSRCAVIRFGKLPDEKILAKLDEICKTEEVKYTDDGLEAVIFTAQGDLRQAINNLQATQNGFGKVTSETVFKVCDEPSPLMVNEMIMHTKAGKIKDAYEIISKLWKLGYSPEDIIGNVFRVTKTADLPEAVKLDYIKQIGLTQLKIAEGLGTLVQLTGLVANLCSIGKAYKPVRKWATNLK